MGEARGITELVEPMVARDRAGGHDFASLAVGEGLGKAYYRGPYENGAAFLLITDDLPFVVEEPLSRIVTVFPQAISAYEVSDHRAALLGYLAHYGFTPEIADRSLVVRAEGEEVLRAEFDEQNRLHELKGTLSSSR